MGGQAGYRREVTNCVSASDASGHNWRLFGQSEISARSGCRPGDRSVKQIRLSEPRKVRFILAPAFGNRGKRGAGLNLLPQRCAARNHVKRQAIKDVFIRRRLPFKTLRPEIVNRFNDGNARQHGPEFIAVENVNLYAVTQLSGMFLKRSAERNVVGSKRPAIRQH